MSKGSSVQDRITRLFLATLELDVPSADTDLFETGMLDSMTFVELLLNLEREFGVKVALEELEVENFRSIGQIAELIVARDGLEGAEHGDPQKTHR